MGLLGSTEHKEENKQDTNKIQNNSVSRLTIKESNTNPENKMNTMDINDIISMPSEAGNESTLESEIDALSKIITDTKDGTQKLEDNDEDFKLDNDDLSFTASFPCDSGVENDKGDLLPDDASMMKDILDSSKEIDRFISSSVTEGCTQEVLDDASKPSNEAQKNEKSDLLKDQKENIELLASSKSAVRDSVIEPSGVNNLSLINQEYDSQESQVCPDSQTRSASEAQQIISSENKTKISKTENVLESLKNQELASDVKTNESISNLSTETRELDTTFDNKLDTESKNLKITETFLEKNKNVQTTESARVDQQDFQNSRIDTSLSQKEKDAKASHSDANKLLKESVTEETPMELVNENAVEKSNTEQQKIVDERDSDLSTEIIESKKNEIVNPVNEIEKAVSRVSEVQVSAKSSVTVPEIINSLEMEQAKINPSGDFKMSQEKEVSEVPLTKDQTIDEMNTENNFLEHKGQITNDTVTDVSHFKVEKIDIKESKELDESKGSNISSTITDESNKEKLKVDSISFEDFKSSDNKQDTVTLEVPNVISDAQNKETDQEATNFNMHKHDLQKTVVENINISEKAVVIVTNETSQNIVTDVVVEDTQIIESIIIDNVQSENDSKISGDNQIVISNTVYSDDKNEMEDTNVKVPVAEKLFIRETDDKANKECMIMQETENTKETVNNLVETTPNSKIIFNIAKTSETDDLVIHANELTTVKEFVQNIASAISHESQEENQNLTLELDESEILKNTNLVESKENIEESKIETVVAEQIFRENAVHEIPEETEDPVEINLSLDPDGNSSPISHDVTEEQMVTDPLDKLIEMENIDSKSTEESDPHQKIDETLNNEQVLESQELTSCAVHKAGKGSGSVLDITLDTEENSNKETAHFAHPETSNFPDIDFQSLDEKSQDSLSILNALHTESISIDQEKENNKFESAGKEDEISLIFDESSQSPRHTESDKFVNDLYKNCVPDDTIDSNDAPVENIEEFNESSSINELNDDISREIKEDTNLVLSLKSGAQSEVIKAPETHLKAFLDNEHANVENSAEISELESAVKFLQESEEQDVQNSRIIQDTINEGNSSIFVAVDDSICDNATENVSDLPETTLDPIAISEAEIISEAAKLENERKEKLQLDHQPKSADEESSDLGSTDITESHVVPPTDNLLAVIKPTKPFDVLSEIPSMDTLKVPLLRQKKLTPGVLPEASLLDERYKEPPKIEIPEISPPLPSTPRASLLIQKDAKQRLESPDRLSVYNEPKITDTPKKDSEKQQQQYPESENIGSPRIILKIAKSAIAECSEPRSPKSPKIRSAANSPNPDDSPGQKLGKIKLKLSKGGHPSIIPNNDEETAQWYTDSPSSASPLGMKIKLSKSGDASVVESSKVYDDMQKLEDGYKPETPIGMKIKLSKSGDASIVQHDSSPKESMEGKLRHKDAKECAQEASSAKKQDSPSIGMKIKLSKSGDASIIQQDVEEMQQDCGRRTDSPIGMKIKLLKSGDASVVSNEHLEDTPDRTEEPFKRTDSPMGVRIKLAKTKSGNASIISSETIEESETAKKIREIEALGDESAKIGIGMKIKLSKSGDASVIRDDSSIEPSRKSGELPIGMKIKLSKTGEPSIIHTDISKKSHLDESIESAKNQPTHADTAMMDLHNKRKEITISPVESKKTKMDANLKQMLPDITIQPIASPIKKDQQKLMLDPNASHISRQQMNVINQEISITQICSLSAGDTLMGDRLKHTLNAQSDPSSSSPLNSDCEIIEPQPELIIVNENSNSSQDIMIIDEVPSVKSLVKVPKKRGRPRRNAVAASAVNIHMSSFQEQFELQRDPLSLDQPPMPMFQQQIQDRMNLHQLQQQLPGAGENSERPRRTCRSQKSYAPPKRGRGRGRGKRKNDTTDIPMKKQRIEQDLTAIENATTAVISLEKLPIETSPELFRALNQPTLERIIGTSKSTERKRDVEFVEIADSALTISTMPPHQKKVQAEIHRDLPEDVAEELEISGVPAAASHLSTNASLPPISDKEVTEVEGTDQIMKKSDTIIIKITEEEDKQQNEIVVLSEHAEMIPNRNDSSEQQHQNWLAPSIRKVSIESTATRTESTMSTLTVMDEETRMSAESCSRSQTPARNISVPGTSEAVLVNEESQGSTATTESEKVKVKIRRMEINLDPDEGPFTVEKIAEYEWPPKDDEARPAATRAETFMIQEQISQYLGVKSFKRKYPDLKRRMVDMEERNFLRENGLVSESMCDMGLTAVSSSEVLDIMCSDFPEQYEEYRKHMREKAAKEHSKKQKELSAAANAERNRIDLAEMAMQSALNWNLGLNKARRESRRCSLDLQTFTVHMPKRAIKFDPSNRGSHYPVALIPGQYTDYYREYTPAELRYYPLNTVLYGPMRPNERKFDSQSEGSQSDSDSDSSSDDSSSSSSEGTQDTEGSQTTMDEVDMELAIQSDIKCKMCLNHLNKSNRPEVLIQCGTCNGNVHPSCIDLTLDMVPHIRAYAWQCTDCKTCAQCHDPADEDKMLFCDMCDRGYHIYCVGLRRVPQGRWHCQECAVCANCGSKEPGGANSDRNSVAQWQHEYKKADKNTRVYVSTFCVPCSKLWRKGRYCPHCSRCHNAPRLDLEPNLVHCGACDKYLHLGCVETKGLIIDKKNYLCEFCSPNRQPLVKPLISKTFKT